MPSDRKVEYVGVYFHIPPPGCRITVYVLPDRDFTVISKEICCISPFSALHSKRIELECKHVQSSP